MTDHEVIWLQPWCLACDRQPSDTGRLWCQDQVWEPCEDCGAEPVRYVLAPAAAPEAQMPYTEGEEHERFLQQLRKGE